MKVVTSFAAGVCVLTACGSDEPEPGFLEPPSDNHEQIVLETIPYDALGSTKLTFKRTQDDVKHGIVSLDGSSRTGSVTYSSYNALWVAASPISEKLLISLTTPAGNQQRRYDIFVRDFAAETGTPLGGAGGMRDYPSWSPDGTRVVYGETAENFSYHSTSIVTQSPVPGAPRQVLWAATGSCEFAHHPRQNAAGVLVFVYSLSTAVCSANDERIARITPGGPLQVIYGPGLYVFSPTWSPSGAEIAFFQRSLFGSGPGVSIRRMAADGSNVRTVAVLPHTGDPYRLLYSMCWPGDGSRIFFNLTESWATSHIYSVVVADGTVTQITTAPNVGDWSLSCS